MLIWRYQEVYGSTLEKNQLFPTKNNNRASLKFKQQITGQTGNGGTKDVESNI